MRRTIIPILTSLIYWAAIPLSANQLNIVFFLIDDLGWRDIGANGSEYYKTPNIDQLAAEGMSFTNAYAASSVCTPTRAAIMTGKYPARLLLTQFLPYGRWDAKKNRLREGRFLSRKRCARRATVPPLWANGT